MYFYDCCVWTLTEDVCNWCCTFIDIGAKNIFTLRQRNENISSYLNICNNSTRKFNQTFSFPLSSAHHVAACQCDRSKHLPTSSIQIFMLCVLYNNIHTVNYLKPSINFEPRYCLFDRCSARKLWPLHQLSAVTITLSTHTPHPHNTGIGRS